ncbi:hypothetical protein FH063_002335 [Azospirillum argentinense]|uniref:Uncharacterized protein n=1 Tax=Azospirillum argentinense TaxID=2970906 RepID=A0A5B0KPS9_9PROT|nr:hypothetical protein FH063_002335 [Azospirillum argentinense]
MRPSRLPKQQEYPPICSAAGRSVFAAGEPYPATMNPQKAIATDLVTCADGGGEAAASRTSFAGLAVLLLGAVAAAGGGSLAVQRLLPVTQRVVR